MSLRSGVLGVTLVVLSACGGASGGADDGTGGASSPSTGGKSSGGASTLGSGGAGAALGGSSSGGSVTTSGGKAASGGASGGAAPSGGTSSAGATGGASEGGAATGGADGGNPSGGESAVTLDQTGNPIYEELGNYQGWLSTDLAADSQMADNMLTWQMPHGGFYKNDPSVYSEAWDGSSDRSGWFGDGMVELGTIDNNATVTELLFLADVYRRGGDAGHADGARQALDFLLTMQYPSGGFPQVYPARSGSSYSNHVTFNDDAMARVLVLLHQIVKQAPPLDGDLFSAEQLAAAEAAITNGVEFILNAQIEQDGVKTVWCAQHDRDNYEPQGARSYELPSKSGSESVGVVGFLMTQPQTPEVQAAVQAAIAWYESEVVQLEDTAYVSRPAGSTDDNYNPIQASPGSTMWCRFYDLAEDVCFFSGRLPTDNPPGEGKQYDIMDIEPERRFGYQWGGSYGSGLLAYARSVGY